ncbi:MAG: TonB-dependent receptor plug domain-containing protein, partial [Saprospiraceae bacterium]
ARWSAGLNLLSINAWWEKPLKKDRMSLLVAFRRSYTDLIQSSTYQNLFNQIFQNGRVALQEQYQEKSEFVTWNPAFRYGDFNMKLRWKGKRGSENAVSLYFGSDQLDYRFAFDDGTNFAATGDHISARNGGLSWQHQAQWSDEFRVDYKVALSAYQNDYRFQWNDEPERPFVYRWNTENKMTDISALFHHVWQVSERHQMSFGYQLTLQEASLVYRDTNAVLLHGNIQVNDTARSDLHTFYGEFSYQPSDKFAFTLGVRENHFPSRGLYYSEPRINFTWRPFGDHFKVKGGMGRYWQFVFQIIDFGDLGVGEPLWALASEQIPAQVLWQWSLGASYQTHSLLIDGEFYLKNNRNLTSLNLQVDRGFDRPWVFDGQSSARGFDFLLRKRWHPYSLWLAYSSGSVTLQFPELNDGLPYPARHDIRQSLNLVNMWAFKRWDFSANLHLRSGSPYSIPGVTQVPCPNCQADSLTYALDFNRLNGERLPGTFRIDLGASYHFETSKTKGKIGLAIYNLLNRRNLLDKDFLLETPPTNEPQTTYQLQALNRLAAGVTPNLFVQFEW